MRNSKVLLMLLSSTLIFGGCIFEEQQKSRQSVEEKLKMEREIIAKLKQTVNETPKREQKAKRVIENPQYQTGYWGEPSPELAEIRTVEEIEGPTATIVLEEVYDLLDFYNEGIMFYERDKDPGFWIGIKEPDERLDELVKILQEKVDNGEILAKYIHIFKSDYSEKDVSALIAKLSSEVNKRAEEVSNGLGRNYGVSVDIKTRAITIHHNFLTDEEQNQIKELFFDYEIIFTYGSIDAVDAIGAN